MSSTAVANLDRRPSADKWSRAEAIAKIVSLVAIPIILAVVGWLVQDKLASSTVSKDYVQLAVSILSQPKQTDIDPALRSWAVELLNHNSPVKFSTEIARQLQSGGATLPIEQSENFASTWAVVLKIWQLCESGGLAAKRSYATSEALRPRASGCSGKSCQSGYLIPRVGQLQTS